MIDSWKEKATWKFFWLLQFCFHFWQNFWKNVSSLSKCWMHFQTLLLTCLRAGGIKLSCHVNCMFVANLHLGIYETYWTLRTVGRGLIISIELIQQVLVRESARKKILSYKSANFGGHWSLTLKNYLANILRKLREFLAANAIQPSIVDKILPQVSVVQMVSAYNVTLKYQI